jgi:uncharacterized alkaline shock family protein YloU
MNIVNRVIMIVVSLIVFVFGAITFLLLTGTVIPANQTLRDILGLYRVLQSLTLLRGVPNNTAIVIALVVALIGLALFIIEIWGPIRRASTANRGKRYVVRQDALGQVTVDNAMVRDWVRHEAEAIPGVVHADPDVKGGKDGLHVSTRTSLAWDANTPSVGQILQERIKDSVQDHLGLPVAEVRVSAQSAPLTADQSRRRVE